MTGRTSFDHELIATHRSTVRQYNNNSLVHHYILTQTRYTTLRDIRIHHHHNHFSLKQENTLQDKIKRRSYLYFTSKFTLVTFLLHPRVLGTTDLSVTSLLNLKSGMFNQKFKIQRIQDRSQYTYFQDYFIGVITLRGLPFLEQTGQ